jgi:hypothetical protein
VFREGNAQDVPYLTRDLHKQHPRNLARTSYVENDFSKLSPSSVRLAGEAIDPVEATTRRVLLESRAGESTKKFVTLFVTYLPARRSKYTVCR